MKKLAITGFSRSGTTALTDLLNLDPRIRITYEKLAFLDGRKNNRRKWNQRNTALDLMEKDPIWTGDKTTRPYLALWEKMREKADKIIFCLRDPRDIFRSRYWDIINEDPVLQYIKLMGDLLEKDVEGVRFVMYEAAVLDIPGLVKNLSNYLELETPLNVEGHNFKPVRRLGWEKKPEVELPDEVYNIMQRFGYE